MIRKSGCDERKVPLRLRRGIVNKADDYTIAYLVGTVGLLLGSEMKSEAEQDGLQHPINRPQRTIFASEFSTIL